MKRALIVLLLVAGCGPRAEEKSKDKDGKVALGKKEGKEENEKEGKVLPKNKDRKDSGIIVVRNRTMVDTSLIDLFEDMPENARPRNSRDVVKVDRASEWMTKNLTGKQVYFISKVRMSIERELGDFDNKKKKPAYAVSVRMEEMEIRFGLLPLGKDQNITNDTFWPLKISDYLSDVKRENRAANGFSFTTSDRDATDRFADLEAKEVKTMGTIRRIRFVESQSPAGGTVGGDVELVLSNATCDGMKLPVQPKK